MSAEIFIQEAVGWTAKAAFRRARKLAAYEHGHCGQTGTIAEKDTFKMVQLKKGEDPLVCVDRMLQHPCCDIDDKWGPAGCVKIRRRRYVFFGVAAS